MPNDLSRANELTCFQEQSPERLHSHFLFFPQEIMRKWMAVINFFNRKMFHRKYWLASAISRTKTRKVPWCSDTDFLYNSKLFA